METITINGVELELGRDQDGFFLLDEDRAVVGEGMTRAGPSPKPGGSSPATERA